jgi:hypothetical protein
MATVSKHEQASDSHFSLLINKCKGKNTTTKVVLTTVFFIGAVQAVGRSVAALAHSHAPNRAGPARELTAVTT